MTNTALVNISYLITRNDDWRDDMALPDGAPLLLDSATRLPYQWAAGALAVMYIKANAADLDSAAVLTLTTALGAPPNGTTVMGGLMLQPGSITTAVPASFTNLLAAGVYQHKIAVTENGIKQTLFYGTVEVRP